MLRFWVTPKQGLFPSLARFDDTKGIVFDFRGRRDAIGALNRQVVCFNWRVQDEITIQVTKSFLKRRDVKAVISKLRNTPVEVKHVAYDSNGRFRYVAGESQ